MHNGFKLWQLIMMLVVFPAVGAFFICARSDVKKWMKILSVLYCLTAFLIILSLRRPVGDITINAIPLN